MLNFADRLMDGLDDLVRGWRGWAKIDPSEYIPIVCAHSENVLALHNGSLVSVIQVHGYMGQYIPDQFTSLHERWKRFMQNNANDRTAKGFDLFWSYEFDPEGMSDFTLSAKERMIQSSIRRGLEVRDILEEEARIYGGICAKEQQLILVVTHLDALPKADHKEALRDKKQKIKSRISGYESLLTNTGIRMIEAIHGQHVNKLMTFMESAGFGYAVERLDAYQAVRKMRHLLAPATTGKGWRARLRLEDSAFNQKMPLEPIQGKHFDRDKSAFLPRSLAAQMTPEGILDLNRYVTIEDRIYAPLYASELATDPEPLENLLSSLYRRKLPIRMVFSLLANSDQANYWNRMFASTFTFGATNRQINRADKAMRLYAEGGGSVIAYALSVVTWAPYRPVYKENKSMIIDTRLIQKRAQDVETLLQQWGGQQVSNLFGCAVEGLFSATPGYNIPPSSPSAPQIESDVLTQMPLMRPAKLWDEQNSIWFRTADGVLSPYQPMSARQNAMLTLVMGGMGFGKSNVISEHVFFFANHPDAEQMPYIRGIDFGASTSGVIDMIRASLPPERQHEALFASYTNDGSLVKNLFDTPLGCRYPLTDHKVFLRNFLSILCDDVIHQSGSVQSVLALLDAAIDRAYSLRDDRNPNNLSQIFRLESAEPLLISMVQRYDLHFEEDPTYWEVVNGIASHALSRRDPEGLYAAKVAQRHCSPQIKDLITVVSQLQSEFESSPLVGGKTMTAAVSNALQNANKMFPCFAGITNTDIGESRVCVFDMSTVFGRGLGAAEDFNRSVFFAAAFRLLTEDLFVSKRETGDEYQRLQVHLGLSDALLQWHLRYLEQQDSLMKVFFGDELHRIGKVEGAFSILNSMAYEGRKYRVGLLLGTQMPEHFPSDTLKLASSIFIFGANQSTENAKVMQKLFDLTDAERESIEGITKPNPVKGAEVFAIHKVDTRTQRIKLNFNLGRIKLWGYATEPDERALRSILYRRGPSTTWARKVLAENVSNLKQLLAKKADDYGAERPSESELIEAIAEQLLMTHG